MRSPEGLRLAPHRNEVEAARSWVHRPTVGVPEPPQVAPCRSRVSFRWFAGVVGECVRAGHGLRGYPTGVTTLRRWDRSDLQYKKVRESFGGVE